MPKPTRTILTNTYLPTRTLKVQKERKYIKKRGGGIKKTEKEESSKRKKLA